MKIQGRPQSSNIEDRRVRSEVQIRDLINASIEATSFPTKKDTDEFLIDSFKRAREYGFKDPRYSFKKVK